MFGRNCTPVKSGSKVEIGLWVPNGKIWVKGFAISGVVTRSGPANGVRVRFDGMAPAERDNLAPIPEVRAGNHPRLTSENGYFELLK